MKRLLLPLAATLAVSCGSPQTASKPGTPKVVATNPFDNGVEIRISFVPGKAFNRPLIAFWIEDMNGNYIQTLYAPKSLATGIFSCGIDEKGKLPGGARRPSSLPYWLHKLGKMTNDGYFLPSPENPLPDAYTGATPLGSFEVRCRVPGSPKQLRLLMELNQPLDRNSHWHSNRFPEDEHYAESAQPALVYSTHIHTDAKGGKFFLTPVGHSHPSGASGELFPDISTFTTALGIAGSVWVEVGLPAPYP